MVEAALGLLTVNTGQATLNILASLFHLTSYRFPPDTKIQGNEITTDYVVIGGGTTGSIVASRLTEDPNVNVAVIEAGGDPPLESVLAGMFPIMPQNHYDYNFDSVNNHYTSQNLQGKSSRMTTGKMLGGSSSMSHTLFLRGHPHDYIEWARVSNDTSWGYESLLPYFIKSERVIDREIKGSPTAYLHGFNGSLGLTRAKSEKNDKYIEALEEIGFKFNPDVNSNSNLGVSYPYNLIAEGNRQDGAQSYLGPAKDRKNLKVYKHLTATKILFDDNNNAVGVEAVTSSWKKIKFYARKEVLLAAGVVKSPQLLMLSGIGPANDLKKFRIPVLADLPVGKNLRDRVGLFLAFQMQADDSETSPNNYHEFPTPITVAYKALNASQVYADYQALNLVVSHDNPGLLQICSNLVKYQNSISDRINDGNKGHEVLLTAISPGHPVSTGEVTLTSTNPYDDPRIDLGHFSNPTDLDDMAKYLLDYYQITKTSVFKKVGGKFQDLNLWKCKNKDKESLDYWKCYAVSMSTTFWQYCGSCAMGSVVDNRLRVMGVQNLRVVDASAVPSLNSGEILAAVVAFAEKATDMIKEDMK